MVINEYQDIERIKKKKKSSWEWEQPLYRAEREFRLILIFRIKKVQYENLIWV